MLTLLYRGKDAYLCQTSRETGVGALSRYFGGLAARTVRVLFSHARLR